MAEAGIMLLFSGFSSIGYLGRTQRSLCRRGLLEETRTTVGKGKYISFKPTPSGERYLDLWTPRELLAEVNRYEGKTEELRYFPLFYIIKKAPMEMLSEFLTSPDRDIRAHAKIRQEVLMKEKACREVID